MKPEQITQELQRLEAEHRRKIHEYVVAFLREEADAWPDSWSDGSAGKAFVERELRRLYRVSALTPP